MKYFLQIDLWLNLIYFFLGKYNASEWKHDKHIELKCVKTEKIKFYIKLGRHVNARKNYMQLWEFSWDKFFTTSSVTLIKIKKSILIFTLVPWSWFFSERVRKWKKKLSKAKERKKFFNENLLSLHGIMTQFFLLINQTLIHLLNVTVIDIFIKFIYFFNMIQFCRALLMDFIFFCCIFIISSISTLWLLMMMTMLKKFFLLENY